MKNEELFSLSFSLNKMEKSRFGRLILPANKVKDIFYESPKSWIKMFSLSNISESYLFGARPPDIAAVLFAINISKKVVVLQHASNPRRKKINVQYLIKNYKKLFFWVMFIAITKAIGLMRGNSTNRSKSHIVVYHYTNGYKLEWLNCLGGLNTKFIRCQTPDVSKYGSIKNIPVCQKHVSCYYVDEPLTTTLGITKDQEQKILKALQEKVGNRKIHVKIHPRSDHKKFYNLQNFVITDSIYPNCLFLAGFKSGLLDYRFNSEFFLKLDERTWRSEKYKKHEDKVMTYIEDVNKDLDHDL